MFFKNLRYAVRTFGRHKITTGINILGLAVGISASIVIFLTIRYDFSFDKWEPKGKQVYRVYTSFAGGDGNYGISMLAPDAIKEKVSGIELMSHFLVDPFYNTTVTTDAHLKGEEGIFQNVQGIIAADDQYFKIFPHKWLAGTPSALEKPGTVVITQKVAKLFFPGQTAGDLIGKPLVFQDSINTVISGVVADIKDHTDFDHKIFISLGTFINTPLLNAVVSTPHWTNVDGNSQCMVRLQDGTDPSNVAAQIKKLYLTHQKGAGPKSLQYGRLQPLSDIHFNTDLGGKVSKSTLRNLTGLAVLLLLLAAINFINLSTAQSTVRAKEIGVRKTFGGSNRQIIYQLLSEILLITTFAAVLALLFVPFLLHVFSGFIPQGLSAAQILQPSMLLFLIVLILLVTLLAGLYPAIVLTRFKPAAVLKNQTANSGKTRSGRVREILIVAQFVLAQVFLIVVCVIAKQIHYELGKDIGLRKQAIVSILIPDYTKRHASKSRVLAAELSHIPQIENMTLCTQAPVTGGWSSTSLTWFDKGDKKVYDNVHVRSADDQYLPVFGLQLLAGSNLRIDTSANVTDVLINESLLRQMGLPDPQLAIGLLVSGGPSDSARIVGVLKDFTTMSLHHPIYPTVIFAGNSGFTPTLAMALSGNSPQLWKQTLDKIEKAFKQIYPYKNFEARFLDETIRNLYQSDIRLAALLKWATGLAVFISCLGLLGLVSFMANKRTKEIGIRKVLGATVGQIILILSKSLLRLILIASVIAIPIGWYFSHKWLRDFAFKTSISWWIFFVSGVSMLMIAMIVLWLRTYRTARANPLNSLKEE